MKIAVICDSATGYTMKEAEALGMFYLPLQVIENDKVYLDGIDITLQEVWDKISKGIMLGTSMPPIGLIEELFEKLIASGYDQIIAIPLSGGLSSTSKMLQATANRLNINLYIVETFTTCNVQKYLALRTQELVDANTDYDIIINKLEDAIKHCDTIIVPNDLDHLAKGGRLTPLAATLGGLLKIKPILMLNESTSGKIDVYQKVRTMSKALKRIIELFEKQSIEEDWEINILHTGAEKEAKELAILVAEKFPNNPIILGNINPVISCHTGLGCLGIQYIKKIK
ncbi:MAG: DegV family protein [Erysipelotrichaceae bacterium]